MLNELEKIWKDQNEFNSNFFPPLGESRLEKSNRTKEFILHMISECDELLRCTEWKLHRRNVDNINTEKVEEELTDVLKYFVSLCLTWDVSPQRLVENYWRKSMVCRQRYSEEFCKTLEGKFAIVDIDGILADYCKGVSHWICRNYPSLQQTVEERILNRHGVWVDAKSLGINEQRWQEIKYRFRTSRGKLEIPLVPGARELLHAIYKRGLKIALLTSRPIDKYPNIYTDTLEWLRNNGLQFDYLWWAVDKKEFILSKNLGGNIRFAIDDDLRYANAYSEIGIECYWVSELSSNRVELSNGIYKFKNLDEVIYKIKKEGKQNESYANIPH